MDRQITRALERFLRAHAREMRPGRDPAIAAVVIETALEALSHKAIIERRDLLTSASYVLRPEGKRRRA